MELSNTVVFNYANCQTCNIRFTAEGKNARHIAANGKVLCRACADAWKLELAREALLEDEEI